jgi:hypothetical protein
LAYPLLYFPLPALIMPYHVVESRAQSMYYEVNNYPQRERERENVNVNNDQMRKEECSRIHGCSENINYFSDLLTDGSFL